MSTYFIVQEHKKFITSLVNNFTN